MAAGRSTKSLMGRRRRAEEEGEDEEGDLMVENSQSEGSLLSDAEEDEAEVSSFGAPDVPGPGDGFNTEEHGAEVVTEERPAGKKVRKSRKKASRKAGKDIVAAQSPHLQISGFKPMADTEAMMNGLQMDPDDAQDIVDFEAVDGNEMPTSTSPTQPVIAVSANVDSQSMSPADRQRRDHEQYRRKRDANPAFIPNRGNFFMHDTRNNQAQSGAVARGAWSARGRGRGGTSITIGGPFSPSSQTAQAERAAEQIWKHDLHDTINEEPLSVANAKLTGVDHTREDSARLFPHTSSNSHTHPRAPLSFSSTTLVGKVQIRVFLAGTKAPIHFSEVPWKQYTRLPDHRPPLRRDKPVRISLPGHSQRYIFPSPDRSFIFIPRQMRPNQQSFGRSGYQRSVGGYGYSSRRTSMYGGSMYAASVAASRRSSFASVARESAFSPVGSYAGAVPPPRPVVRLPYGSQGHLSAASTPMGPLSGHQTPTGMQVHTFPLPQQPTFQGTPTTTMHQPRPQKAISVTGIESPAALQQAPAPSESQPFQNQLPAHMNDQAALGQHSQQAYFSPRQSFPYPHQPHAGTPLSGIPEQAMHAPSLQAPMLPYGGTPYYGPYQPQQNFYYPPGPGVFQQMPMYVPPTQGYMMSPPTGPMPLPQTTTHQHTALQPSAIESEHPPGQQQSQTQSGMVAHESNGMVFYLPAAEARQHTQGENNYQPAESFVPSYAMPGLPPPTPAPEAAYYYPPQLPAYYPSQSQHQ